MKTTLEELKQLFRLKDNRQLKAGLVNKIKFIDENNIEIQDEQLKELLSVFRNGGAYDSTEVCKLYRIARCDLDYLAEHNLVPSYKLVSSQGSKRLFLKSEIEKENLLLLVRCEKTETRKLLPVINHLLSFLAERNAIDAKRYEMFMKYFQNHSTLQQIADEYGMTREGARVYIDRIRMELHALIRKQYDVDKEKEEKIGGLEKKYVEMCAKYAELKSCSGKQESEQKETEQPDGDKLKTKIRDMDLSVRLHNVFNRHDVMYAADLLKLTKKDFMNMNNFGKKSLVEVEKLFNWMGFPFV